MKRAALYLRVSSMGQVRRAHSEEGYSIETQRAECQKKARQREEEIVCEEVDYGESAKMADRPGLNRLLERIREKRDIDTVIVFKVDRFARNMDDDVIIGIELKQLGVQLVSVMEPFDESPFGQLMRRQASAYAEFYSANLSAEAKRGLHQKAKLGGTPCAAPIGYLNVRKDIEGREIRTVEIDPERAPHVRWAFVAYASGTHTLDTLQAALQERGLVSRPTPTRPAKPLGRSQVSRMLTHPYYIGIVRYAGAEHPGKHEPLIDRDTWQRANAVLAAHSKAKERDRKHHHYLKGSLVCGRCGSALSYVKARGKKGGIYWYFACLSRMRRTGCDLPYLAAEQVEDRVAAAYENVRLDQAATDSLDTWSEHLREIQALVADSIQGLQDENIKEVRQQRRRIDRIKNRQRKLLDAYLADSLSMELLAEKQADLNRELAEAERVLVAAEAGAGDTVSVFQNTLDLVRTCDRTYADANRNERRLMNQALFAHFKVDAEEVTGELQEHVGALTSHATLQRLREDGSEDEEPDSSARGSNKAFLAERVGFEPTRQLSPPTRFPIVHLKPLGHPSG